MAVCRCNCQRDHIYVPGFGGTDLRRTEGDSTIGITWNLSDVCHL